MLLNVVKKTIVTNLEINQSVYQVLFTAYWDITYKLAKKLFDCWRIMFVFLFIILLEIRCYEESC